MRSSILGGNERRQHWNTYSKTRVFKTKMITVGSIHKRTVGQMAVLHALGSSQAHFRYPWSHYPELPAFCLLQTTHTILFIKPKTKIPVLKAAPWARPAVTSSHEDECVPAYVCEVSEQGSAVCCTDYKSQATTTSALLPRHISSLGDSYVATKQNPNLHKQKTGQLVIKSYINTNLNYTKQMAAHSRSIN